MQHYVLGVTVGLMNEGLKSWKKKEIECDGFMNSFENLSVFYIRVNFNWSC